MRSAQSRAVRPSCREGARGVGVVVSAGVGLVVSAGEGLVVSAGEGVRERGCGQRAVRGGRRGQQAVRMQR